MWGSKDENPNRCSETLSKPASDQAAGHQEHCGYVPRPGKSVVEVTARRRKWFLAPRPQPQAPDGEDADVRDALGSQRFREGAGFWGAVRTITARVTPVKVKERPCQDPRPLLPRPSSHLLPRQGCPSAPGHLGGEGGSPGRGAEVLCRDGQELGDAELLGHGGREVWAPGLSEWGPGGACCTARGRPLRKPREPSGTRRAPPPPCRPAPFARHSRVPLRVPGAPTFPTPPASQPRPRPSSLSPHLSRDRPAAALAGLLGPAPGLLAPENPAPGLLPRPRPIGPAPGLAAPESSAPGSLPRPWSIGPAPDLPALESPGPGSLPRLRPIGPPSGLPASENPAPGSLPRPWPVDPAPWPPGS